MGINKQRLKDFFGTVYHREMINDSTIDKFLNVLKDLSEREMAVIINRYGLIDNEPKSLNQLAKKYNTTVDEIRNVEMAAIKKLRDPATSKLLEEEKGNIRTVLINSDYLPDGITFADINEALDKQK